MSIDSYYSPFVEAFGISGDCGCVAEHVQEPLTVPSLRREKNLSLQRLFDIR